MSTRTAFLVLLASLVLGACDSVTSPVPLGEEPAALNASDWNGRWENATGYMDITVVDAANGLVHISYDDDGECEELDVQLRTSGEWIFFNVTERDFEESEGLASSPCSPAHVHQEGVHQAADEDAGGYFWGRVIQRDTSIIAWAPSPEAFVRLVETGRIPGTVDGGSVVLGPLGEAHYQTMISGSAGVVLDWEQPLVLYRASAE